MVEQNLTLLLLQGKTHGFKTPQSKALFFETSVSFLAVLVVSTERLRSPDTVPWYCNFR